MPLRPSLRRTRRPQWPLEAFMKDDKKKLIVVVALALVIVCVGAFQFLAGGSPAPAVTAPKKDQKKDVAAQPANEPPKNPLFAQSLPAHDPFGQPANATKPNPAPAQPQPTP